MPPIRRRAALVGALVTSSTLLACLVAPIGASATDTREGERGRPAARPALLVTDAEAAQASVVDVHQRRVSGVFPLASSGYAHAGGDGHYAYAVQADGDRTSAIDVTGPVPRMLGTSLTGGRPIHFVAHDDKLAIFHDADGSATILDESTGQAIPPQLEARDRP